MAARTAVIPLFCCLSVAAVFSATLLSPAAPADAAAPIGTLQTEAAQLSQKMLLEQMQVSGYQQQHAAELAQAQADEQELSTTQSQIDVTRRHIARDMSDLQQAAVKSYVDGGTAVDGTNQLFSNDPTNGAGAVYEQVMTGNVSAAVDRLQVDRRQLRAEETTEQQLVAQADQAVVGSAVLLAQAQSTEQAFQQQSAQVNGQLAAAIAQQQAAEAAAAQAQLAAARPASGRTVAVVATTGAPVLNAFLTCVITKESGGDYQAVSPTGQYMGAFQFSQPTWNEAAQLAGLPTLVGVRPDQASPTDQDLLAIALYNADGEQPWYDPCRAGF